MQNSRTGGMTAMGILNIIYGSIFTLIFGVAVLLGGLLAAGGTAMEAELGAEAEGMGTMAATGGGILALIGIVGMVIYAMLFIAGIGVIMVKPWGRTLCIVSGVGIIGVNLLSMFGQGFGILTLLGIGYSATLLGLCFSETWKQAFSGNASAMSHSMDQFQPATMQTAQTPPTIFAGEPGISAAAPQPSAQASTQDGDSNDKISDIAA